ncbi:MAG TPA: MerR family DNA-binding protein [Terriglobales bacterium]|nr:MerR family DNA-binding protein [Terriglobales bacterium]
MTIGQLAREAGVNLETVRFYERKGLMPRPARRPSGYREYAPEAARRIRFIRRAKELGFSLREVGELLRLRVDPRRSCADVKRQAEAKLADIEGKLRELRHMKVALKKLASECTGRGPTSQCPLLDALEAVEKKRK